MAKLKFSCHVFSTFKIHPIQHSFVHHILNIFVKSFEISKFNYFCSQLRRFARPMRSIHVKIASPYVKLFYALRPLNFSGLFEQILSVGDIAYFGLYIENRCAKMHSAKSQGIPNRHNLIGDNEVVLSAFCTTKNSTSSDNAPRGYD
jgi:hypothetical protein